MTIFDLPPGLSANARELLQQEQADRDRSDMKKRFALGFTPGELKGLYVGGRQLNVNDLKAWGLLESGFVRVSTGADGSRSRETPLRSTPRPGAAEARPPATADVQQTNLTRRDSWGEPLPMEGESWVAFVRRLLADTELRLGQDPDYLNWAEKYLDGLQPEWLSGRRLSFSLKRAAVYRKRDDEAKLQGEFFRQIHLQCGRESGLVPLIYIRLPRSEPQSVIGIMPLLEPFVTLHEILWAHSRLSTRGLVNPVSSHSAFPRDDREAEIIYRAVGEELDRYLSIPLPRRLDERPSRALLERYEERFSPDHQVPLVLGRDLYADRRQFALSLLEQELAAFDVPGHRTIGHGDLNATNIMVAVRRERERIVDVAVRLIDPNPSSQLHDSVIEVARLLHWVELGVPLRVGSQTGQEVMRVDFPACGSASEFHQARPQTLMAPHTLAQLPQAYRLLLSSLRGTMSCLKDWGAAQRKLSLGVALYHLVATKYWPRNVDRAAAFLGGVGELERLARVRAGVPELGAPQMREVRWRQGSRARTR